MKKLILSLALLTVGAMYGAANNKNRAALNRLTGHLYLYDALDALVKPGAIPELQTESLKPMYDLLTSALTVSDTPEDFDIADGYIDDALNLPAAKTEVEVPHVGKFPLSELIRTAQAGDDIFESARNKVMLERLNKLLNLPAFQETFGQEEFFKKLLESKDFLKDNDEQAASRSLQQAITYFYINPDKNRNYVPSGASEGYSVQRMISYILQDQDPELSALIK